MTLPARIDALLPQTQCTRCGFAGCLPYAGAIAAGEAGINQCPPGGAATIHALADLLHRDYVPLNPANGTEGPPRLAWVDEARCIGCARCLAPCPVDAIVGAARFMHTVLVDHCTGCELCVAACPVDCIAMRDGAVPAASEPERNRARYHAHTTRLSRRIEQRQSALDLKKATATPSAATRPARPAADPP